MKIRVALLSSQGIKIEAAKYGITVADRIGGGYCEGHENNPDWYVGFYSLINPINKLEFRVADTNGDPLWEEEYPDLFADLARQCGVEI